MHILAIIPVLTEELLFMQLRIHVLVITKVYITRVFLESVETQSAVV
jgi:hypothetical protein